MLHSPPQVQISDETPPYRVPDEDWETFTKSCLTFNAKVTQKFAKPTQHFYCNTDVLNSMRPFLEWCLSIQNVCIQGVGLPNENPKTKCWFICLIQLLGTFPEFFHSLAPEWATLPCEEKKEFLNFNYIIEKMQERTFAMCLLSVVLLTFSRPPPKEKIADYTDCLNGVETSFLTMYEGRLRTSPPGELVAWMREEINKLEVDEQNIDSSFQDVEIHLKQFCRYSGLTFLFDYDIGPVYKCVKENQFYKNKENFSIRETLLSVYANGPSKAKAKTSIDYFLAASPLDNAIVKPVCQQCKVLNKQPTICLLTFALRYLVCEYSES